MTSGAPIQLAQVFVPGGMPTYTYNAREDLRLEERIQDYLQERHKILSLSGQTKCGKTVLLKAAIPDAIWLSGGSIGHIDEFWSTICDWLRLSTGFETGSELTDGAEFSTTGSGGVKPFGIGAHVDRTRTASTASSRTESQSRTSTYRDAAREALQSNLHTLIVDDFHYIDGATQLAIVRSLKPLVFDGLTVVFASVPHRAYDALRVEKEMTGRLEQLHIPLWRPDELQAIAREGFSHLNIEDRRSIGRRLATYCYQSPHLMQEFCLQLCKQQGIRHAQVERYDLQPPDDWNAFFRARASNASKTAFDLLARGPRQRTDRKPRKRVDGSFTDIYGAVLTGIAHTGPQSRITYEQLRASLREVLDGELPARHEVTSVLEQMTKIAKEQIEGEPVVDYDQEMAVLHVTDPFFSFFLRWGSLEQNLAQPPPD